MRNLLLLSLLASAAVVAPAQAQDRREPRAEQSDHPSSSSEDRGSRRSERSFSRRSSDDSSQSQSRSDNDRPVMRERPSGSGQQFGGFTRRDRGGDSDAPASVSSSAGDSVRNWRGRDRRPDSPTQVQERNLETAPATVDNRTIEERNLRRFGDGAFDRNVRTTPGFGDRRVRRIGNNIPVEGTAPPPVSSDVARRGDSHRRWTSDWRRDGRYDWRRHRDRNRSRFHLGIYFDPFGWNYRRYSIGWRLWPDYYSSSYWLNDPWSYRLPPAYGPYRWIRYHDDALLVNVYTGTVVDVIYNFFW